MTHPATHGEPCPRLIEVALPIREVSVEAVRQKSPQRGHVSTLRLCWARCPLAAARAVVFASLVPDPDHPRCPASFREVVERHLKTHVPADLTKTTSSPLRRRARGRSEAFGEEEPSQVD